jgi:hypothetical protein
MTRASTPHRLPVVLVDSGTNPDSIRCYFEIPDVIAKRLNDAGNPAATFVANLETVLDERDAALEAATAPDLSVGQKGEQ